MGTGWRGFGLGDKAVRYRQSLDCQGEEGRLRPDEAIHPDLPLAPAVGLWGNEGAMIAPETFNHIENIKKRAGHLWRFL
jgi:hypothetical protein